MGFLLGAEWLVASDSILDQLAIVRFLVREGRRAGIVIRGE